MRKNIKTLFIATSLFLIPFILTAQKTEIKKSDDLKQALENYHSKNYSLSLEQFTSYIEKNKANNTLSLEDAYFFQASCAYELMNNDTDKLLLDFINNFQESHRVNDAKFLFGICNDEFALYWAFELWELVWQWKTRAFTDVL